MKIALIYYSFSGKTSKAVEYLKERFTSGDNQVEIVEIKPQSEERNFFKQGMAALRKQTCDLSNYMNYDLSEFDYIILATAVWAFSITVPLRSYLEKAKNLENKNTGFFLTCGSGTGAKKALGELESILIGRGAKIVCSAVLKGNKVTDIDYLDKQLTSFLNFRV